MLLSWRLCLQVVRRGVLSPLVKVYLRPLAPHRVRAAHFVALVQLVVFYGLDGRPHAVVRLSQVSSLWHHPTLSRMEDLAPIQNGQQIPVART